MCSSRIWKRGKTAVLKYLNKEELSKGIRVGVGDNEAGHLLRSSDDTGLIIPDSAVGESCEVAVGALRPLNAIPPIHLSGGAPYEHSWSFSWHLMHDGFVRSQRILRFLQAQHDPDCTSILRADELRR